MILVASVAKLHAFQQLVSDIWVTRGSEKGWEPIETGEDSVLDGARLNVARPAGDARRAEAALVGRSFLALERCDAAVG